MAPPKKSSPSKKTSTVMPLETYNQVENIAHESKWTVSQTIAILVEEAINARKNAQ